MENLPPKSPGQRYFERFLAAPAYPQVANGQPVDWESTSRAEPSQPPMRARGSLSQEQLAEAEAYAFRYGIGLPSPADTSTRQTALAMVCSNMKNTIVRMQPLQIQHVGPAEKLLIAARDLRR
jgi:hypothetical protein